MIIVFTTERCKFSVRIAMFLVMAQYIESAKRQKRKLSLKKRKGKSLVEQEAVKKERRETEILAPTTNCW